jgi:hypothetical protein
MLALLRAGRQSNRVNQLISSEMAGRKGAWRRRDWQPTATSGTLER